MATATAAARAQVLPLPLVQFSFFRLDTDTDNNNDDDNCSNSNNRSTLNSLFHPPLCLLLRLPSPVSPSPFFSCTALCFACKGRSRNGLCCQYY